MLPLPWWILGANPDETDDEPESDDAEDAPKEESCLEDPSLSLFRTPSASPLSESVDRLPKVVDVSTFMNVAKRRSSSRMEEEWVSPKLRKTAERKSFVRNETEIMNKTADGNSLEETDGVPARSGSPMPFGDVFNETFFFDDNNNQVARNEQSSSEESPRSRDYPYFFSSFNDDTVVFNTTIAGDIDLNKRNDAVGDWIFKSNEFFNSATPRAEISGSGDTTVFKEPMKRGRKAKANTTSSDNPSSSQRTASVRVKEEEIDLDDEEHDKKMKEKEQEPKKNVESKKKTAPKKKEQQEKKQDKKKKKIDAEEQEDDSDDDEFEGPIIPTRQNRTPSLTRRHTPSRKVKTYKSLRE